MRAGDLRHSVVIQKEYSTRDSYGAETPEWVDFATVWAGISPIRGREYFAAQTVNADVDTKIIIRHLQELEPKMRMKYGERIFEIVSVINVEEKNREVHLMCKEVAA